MPSPIKRKLPAYKNVEKKLMKVIADKFGFDHKLHSSVKEADKKVLEIEWEYFVNGNEEHTIWPISDIKKYFLSCFNEIK
jgi:hypothetical protein